MYTLGNGRQEGKYDLGSLKCSPLFKSRGRKEKGSEGLKDGNEIEEGKGRGNGGLQKKERSIEGKNQKKGGRKRK